MEVGWLIKSSQFRDEASSSWLTGWILFSIYMHDIQHNVGQEEKTKKMLEENLLAELVGFGITFQQPAAVESDVSNLNTSNGALDSGWVCGM
ncbi:hypothetical protein T11_8208 [Trichinella zimbabwensis]|uniref:Uncharacterized protein n=1 Tax=Trichinella zimbabwensis TaxID=268475 RepID=A0A0V1H0R5_9BILA|nr:hypothetical protein T11_8208 [Trichinella zimbabwensis]